EWYTEQENSACGGRTMTHAIDVSDTIGIGKIVRSESHVRYTCQVYGPGEVAVPPAPADFAFGSFVRIPLRASAARPSSTLLAAPPSADVVAFSLPSTTPKLRDAQARLSAIGLIYDTILVNPAFGALGPRLSNDEQVEIFSPDYLSERAVLV